MTVKQVFLAGLFSFGVASIANAASPSIGLGQSWPNAPDVSVSPHWHAYVFQKDGIRYIQINDLAGHVQGAFATAGGQYLILPIGSDAATATSAAGAAEAGAETVYQDGATQVTAAPQANGTILLRANAVSTGCDGDPVKCSTNLH